jgi:hypothetical protein
MPDARGYKGELVSYVTLRRIVGLLGVSLPVVLAVWGFALCHCVRVQASISDYYALRTRDALVGILFTIGWFLYTYRGYDRRDNVAGNLAGVLALGVALFPNTGSPLERRVHFGSALGLFLILAYFALFLFTKSSGNPTPQKRIRNAIYRLCGVSMLCCIVAIGVYYAALVNTALSAWQPVFWLESLALWSFGISWFVKGETLFTDRNGGAA